MNHRPRRATSLEAKFSFDDGGVASLVGVGFLTAALLVGGTSEQGAALGFALELISLIILVGTLLFGRRVDYRHEIPGVALIGAAVLLLYASQLLPLAPALWTALPGRGLVVSGFALLHLAPGWQPLSMSKGATIASALALLPAACAISLSLRIPQGRLMLWGMTLTALSCLSVLVGIAQLVGGEESLLHFYVADPERARGFFANPNHQATLLLATLPMLGALIASRARAASGAPPRALWIVSGAVTLLLALGVLITGSMAGVILFVPTLLASLAVVFRTPSDSRKRRAKGVKIVLLSLLTASVPLGLMTLSGRVMRHHEIFGEDRFDRLGLAKATFEAMKEYWPFGSGLGSFPAVYPAHEQLGQVSEVFVNHAHNEYLEILFEAGIFGLAIIILFLLWWGQRTYQAWASKDDEAVWRQAASIAIAVVIAHSSVDYPLRTPAMLVVLGCCMAILDRRPVPSAPPSTSGFGPQAKDFRSTKNKVI